MDACSCVAKKPLVSIFQVCSGAEHVMNSNMTSMLQITLWQHIRLASQFAVCARKNKTKIKLKAQTSKIYKNVSVNKILVTSLTRGSMFKDNLSLSKRASINIWCQRLAIVRIVLATDLSLHAANFRMSRQSECRLVLAQNLSGPSVVCQVRCADSLVKELRWCKPPICPRWDSIYLSELTGGRIF